MPKDRKKSNLAAARTRMYHDLVFECAERTFGETGFAESSMQDLAAEAGISLKTLYATFPGKDDIYKEILAVRGLGLLEAIRLVQSAEGTPTERLAIGVRGIVSYLVEHPDFFHILLQEGHGWGLAPRGEEARVNWQAGISTVRDLLADGMKTGEFLPGDPGLLAPTVNAVLQAQLAGLLERNAELNVDAISDEILRTMMRLLCGASGPTPSD